MSLFSSCKRGKLDGVKAALSRGEMAAMCCDERLKCVKAALQTKRNGALMDTLMEHLDLDRFEEWMNFDHDGMSSTVSFLSLGENLSFHSNCIKRGFFSGSLNGLTSEGFGQLFQPQSDPVLEGLRREGLHQKMENDKEIIKLTQSCTLNTQKLVQIHLTVKEAKKGALLSKKKLAEEQMGSKREEEGDKKVETIAVKKESKARKKGNRNKKKKPDEVSDSEIPQKFNLNNASNEKVRVKAELRSKISDLELEEEKEKQALASEVEKKNVSMLNLVVLQRSLAEVLEKNVNLEEEMRDVDATIKSLLARKKGIAEKQKAMEREMEERMKMIEELKDSAHIHVKEQTEKLEKVQEDLENVRKELDLVEGRKTKSTDLEKFLARQMEELRGELECPVCMEVVTRAPIYKCDDDHLICRYWSSQESEDVL